jgi:hypothetical protein
MTAAGDTKLKKSRLYVFLCAEVCLLPYFICLLFPVHSGVSHTCNWLTFKCTQVHIDTHLHAGKSRKAWWEKGTKGYQGMNYPLVPIQVLCSYQVPSDKVLPNAVPIWDPWDWNPRLQLVTAGTISYMSTSVAVFCTVFSSEGACSRAVISDVPMMAAWNHRARSG